MSNLDGEAVVWALDEKDGKKLWVTPLGKAYPQRMPQSKEGPSCSPTVDGDRLYAIGMGGELACLQVADGKILWQRNFPRDFGGKVPTWSYRESPLVDGAKVVCTPGGADATVVALDKMTGKTIWKCAAPGSPSAAYSSITAFDFQGQREMWRSPGRRSSALRLTTGNSSGNTTNQPAARASTARRRSTTMAWSSPPRPMAREADWCGLAGSHRAP